MDVEGPVVEDVEDVADTMLVVMLGVLPELRLELEAVLVAVPVLPLLLLLLVLAVLLVLLLVLVLVLVLLPEAVVLLLPVEVVDVVVRGSPYPMLHVPGERSRVGLPRLSETDVGAPERDRMVDPGGRMTVALNGDVKLTAQAPPVMLVSASVS